MLEFLIKRIDGDYFSIHPNDFPNVLRPASMPSKKIDGWGSNRILIKGEEISFSDEMVGLQVCFETGTLEQSEAEQIMSDILMSIERFTGEKGKIVQISY